MNKQERELEELVNEIENSHITVPPLFELFVTTFSISISILLFVYSSMLESSGSLYEAMLAIMPQSYWAMAFFIACMFKAFGLLLDKDKPRIIGLGLSVAIYLLLTICYALSWPSIGAVTFGSMTLFAVISIPFVKHTSIKWHKGGEHE